MCAFRINELRLFSLCHRRPLFPLHLLQIACLILVNLLRDELPRCLVECVERGHVDSDHVPERLDPDKFAPVGARDDDFSDRASGNVVLRQDFDLQVW